MASTADILNRLAHLWWRTALLAVIGGLAGLAYAVLTPATYIARAYVVVVSEDPTESAEAVSYAQTYARIATQGDVINAAVAAGGTSAGELRRDVQASGSPDAPVIEITSSSRNADRAADLANLMAGGLVSTANDHRSRTRMKLTVLSPASPPDGQSSPKPVLDVAVGAAAGILLGGLATLIGADRASTHAGRTRTQRGSPAAPPQQPPDEVTTMDLTDYQAPTAAGQAPIPPFVSSDANGKTVRGVAGAPPGGSK